MDLVEDDVRELAQVLAADQLLQQDAGRTEQQPRVLRYLLVLTDLKK